MPNTVAARAKASGIYDCLNHIMLDSIIDLYSTGEISLAVKNIKKALELLKGKKVLLIFDREYPAVWLLYYLNKLGVKYLFRTLQTMYIQENYNNR